MRTSIEEGGKEIYKAIQKALAEDDGCLIGRTGSIELEHILYYTCNKKIFSEKLHFLEKNAGIFPAEQFVVEKWLKESIQAIKDSDVLVTNWHEALIEDEEIALGIWKCRATQIPLRSLEPYYVSPENQWTRILSGHRVSVVGSFQKSSSEQSKNLQKIWGDLQVLPSVDWRWVQTGHPSSIAMGTNEWPEHVETSLDAIDYIVSEVVKQESRFALIGCGGIGMIVASRLKKRGIIAIVMGGAIQVLFGIKGKRWENHEISRFWNEHWICPCEEEIPGLADTIENGCYWYNEVQRSTMKIEVIV